MKEYLISVITVSILSSLIIGIIPEGKTSKTIIFCINLILSISIIFPIINKIKNGDFSLNIIETQNYSIDEKINTDYIRYSIEKRVENNKKIIENYLTEKNLNGEIKIEYDIDASFNIVYKKISVKLNKKVIIKNQSNINIIEEIKNYVSSLLLVDKEIIEVYE